MNAERRYFSVITINWNDGQLTS